MTIQQSKTRTQSVVRTLFWGAILSVGVGMSVSGLVGWAVQYG